MSNTQVGTVYSKIIDDVIGQCRGPFEEEGAESKVLDEFKKTWQAKLSLRKVADMPWDPKPPPPAPAAPQAPQPRAAPYVPQQTQHQAPQPDVKVKIESTDLANLQPQQFTHALPQDIARQRAAEQVRHTFGESAQASIAQLQQSSEPHGVKRPLPQSSPTSEGYDAKRQALGNDYSRGHQQLAAQRMQQLNAQQLNAHQLAAAQRQQHQPIGSGQTDGAAEWAQMVAERRALVADGTAAADMSIAERVAALQRMEEGNGVMQPHSKQKKVVRSAPRPSGPTGFDGVDDDEEEVKDDPDVDDADAINSDLDDPEEDDALVENEEEKDEEIMVCTYEKVARVKNKWKCVLKDGILITGGKEYVFGKATGEFEW